MLPLRPMRIAAFALATSFAAASVHAQTEGPPAMPPPASTAPAAGTRLIVTYRDAPDSAAAQAANRAVGASLIRPLSVPHAAVVRLPTGADVDQALAALKAQPGVVDAQVDGRMSVQPVRGPRIGQ